MEGRLVVVDEHFCCLVSEVCSELVFPHLECGFVVLFQTGVVLVTSFLECLLCARAKKKKRLSIVSHERERYEQVDEGRFKQAV